LGLVLLGAAIGALDRTESDSPVNTKLKKGLGILLVACGVYVVLSLIPIPGKVVPQINTVDESSVGASHDIWGSDLETALKQARESEKRVILDFTAKWCAACKELDHKTFSQQIVRDKLKTMIPVKIDCTDSRNPEVKKIQETYGVKGLPTIIVLDHEGDELARFVSFLPPDQFIQFIEKIDII
jgi:thioredoxin:protein disulfide reductase